MTKRQSECLEFIKRFLKEQGFSPSYEEIRLGLGASSKSIVYRLVTALCDQGLVTRLPHRNRTVRPV